MLVRALTLSAIWFALSLFATLIAGSRLRRDNFRLSVLWLAVTVVVGNIIALVMFGRPLEVAGLSILAFGFGLFWIMQLREWNASGQVTWAMTLMTTGLFLIYALLLTAFSPLNPVSFLLAFIFFCLEAVNLLLALAHMHESLDVTCRTRWNFRLDRPTPVPDFIPMVSLHVPAHNEPVDLVRRTLESLARLNYPNYEVIIVDNNTPLEATWRPLEAVCRSLGPRFHCLHVDNWPGYKSGALNFALTQTDPSAEIVGIIDADYEVEPDFLHDLVPAFTDPNLAFVQTPQDYRGIQKSLFAQSSYRGYRYFFEVSMQCRNEHNAIIVAGTMGLIRKSVLEEIGGWDEWCITEDAEASLRILKRGYRSLYIHKAYGHGLMPFDFESLKKQRYRWCFGGIQILKKHWEALMPWAKWVDPENKLTLSQRYYYLVGGLGWFTDLFNLVFAFFLVLGAAFSIFSSPVQIRPLTNTILVVPAVFLILHLIRFLWVLRERLRISLGMAIATMYNFFSLGWAVALACIEGLIQKEGTFLRTPKSRATSRIGRAVQVTQWETAIGWICATAGLTALFTNQNWRTSILCVLLLWQGSLYIAAPVFSLLGVGGEPAEASRVTDQGKAVLEKSAARSVVAIFMVLIGAFSLIRLLPPPPALPRYANFLPVEPSPQAIASRGQTKQDPPTATISVESTYCWSGPGKPARKLSALFKGQRFVILGRNADLGNTWWYVKDPATGVQCWIWGLAVSASGPVNNIPVVNPGG